MSNTRGRKYKSPGRRRANGEAKFLVGVITLWVLGFLVNIGIIAVIIWAIIALVRHVTG